MSTEQFNITGGPSVDRLIDSLKYAFDALGDHVTVLFNVDRSTTTDEQSPRLLAEVVVRALRYETDSSGMFIFEGDLKWPKEYIKGFYNGRTRQGTFVMMI